MAPPGTSRESVPAAASRQASPAVSADGLAKVYGGRRVVDGLSFTIARGEVFALLGPNGAGKTTTVEILEGYRVPDAGDVRVLGLDPRRQGAELKPRIGVMLQESQLYQAIGVREAVALFASFYNDPRDPDDVLRLVGLQERAKARFRGLSGGERQRLSLALALVGRPELVFLDEPTAGMDPHARQVTWGIIRSLRQRGVTVLLTTHFMDEAEHLADHIAIISRGRLLALGTPADLTRADASLVRLKVGPPIDAARLVALPAASRVREEQPGDFLIDTPAAPDLLVQLTEMLRGEGVLPAELRVGRGSLEDVFLELTREEVTR